MGDEAAGIFSVLLVFDMEGLPGDFDRRDGDLVFVELEAGMIVLVRLIDDDCFRYRWSFDTARM